MKLCSAKINLEDLADLLEKNGKFLDHNPSCSYLVRPTLGKLKRLSQYLDKDEARMIIARFASFLENDVWNSGSSTVSGVLNLRKQREFVSYIAKYISEMAIVLRERKFKQYLAIENNWRRDFNPFLEHVRISSTRLRSTKGAIVKFAHELQPWERKFCELINKHGLIMQEEEPIFLLKSGYRSMYFFNPSHLISKSNVNNKENLEILNEFREILKIFLQNLKNELGDEKIAVLLTHKVGGEDPGTSQFAPLFTELGVNPVHLDPQLDMLKGPVIEGSPSLIPFDGVTTTGRTVDDIIEKYERIMKYKPQIYSLLLNRSIYSKRKDVPIWSIGPSLILSPEILYLSIASYDSDLGYWWPSLLMFHDYLKEIYLYADEDLSRYTKTLGEFKELITDFYEIKMVDGKAQLFDYFDTKLPLNDVTAYLINLHILCWNNIFDTTFSREISPLEDPVEYVETMLRFEKLENPTLGVCSTVLKKNLKENDKIFPKLIEPCDMIHRIYVQKTQEIIQVFKNEYKEPKRVNMKTQIKMEVVNRIIDDTFKKRRKAYKQLGKNVQDAIDDEDNLRKLYLTSIRKLYEIVEE